MHSTARGATTVLAMAAVAVAGCSADEEVADRQVGPPTATGSPTVAAPVPTPTSDGDPGPPPGPSSAPSTPPAGPPAQDDGCPPPRQERAAPLPRAAQVPTTSTRTLDESPGGRPVEVTSLTVATPDGTGAAITAAIDAEVDAVVAAWEEGLGDASADDTAEPAPQLEVDVTATRVDESVVSVVLDGYRYLGGASGDELADAWVFSSATGDQLALADVGLGGACLDELGGLVADRLVEQEVGLFEEAEEALRAGEVSMERWALDGDRITVHVPEYEVAPGVAGAPAADLDLDAVRAATGTPLTPAT